MLSSPYQLVVTRIVYPVPIIRHKDVRRLHDVSEEKACSLQNIHGQRRCDGGHRARADGRADHLCDRRLADLQSTHECGSRLRRASVEMCREIRSRKSRTCKDTNALSPSHVFAAKRSRTPGGTVAEMSTRVIFPSSSTGSSASRGLPFAPEVCFRRSRLLHGFRRGGQTVGNAHRRVRGRSIADSFWTTSFRRSYLPGDFCLAPRGHTPLFVRRVYETLLTRTASVFYSTV